MRSKAIEGRHLGWSAGDLQTKPYANYWQPTLSELSRHAQLALFRGPVAEPLLPVLADASRALWSDAPVVENGFCLTAEGAMHIAINTEMPQVTPAMIDWWFGWHSDSPERYKLWHPQAHVHAQWLSSPPKGSRGRSRYWGQTSIVDEYVGSELGRYAIRFIPPAELGLTDATLADDSQATAICARVGLGDYPVDAGYLIHHVRRTTTGSEMRSRFWIGGAYAAPRQKSVIGSLAVQAAKQLLRPTEHDARALLVHCAEEMAHLAVFLPQLYSEYQYVD